MKTIKNILLFVAIVIVIFGCQRNIRCDVTDISLKDYPEETLTYMDRIGKNYDTALDSLFRYLNCPSEIIYLKVPLEVNFDCDNRVFYGISFADEGEYTDVLDTKGNYYTSKWHNTIK